MATKKTPAKKSNKVVYVEPTSYFSPEMKKAMAEYEAKQKKTKKPATKKK